MLQWLITWIERWLSQLEQRLRRLGRVSVDRDPLVAVIRREGVITEGRYVIYFEVVLFADNPVMLEDFGPALNRDETPPPSMKPAMRAAIRPYRYYVELRQRFSSFEEARAYWVARGATALWSD
ncbi:MAG: hypothetical protein ACKO6N_26360 [Myxococcota bacterium]